MRFVDRRCTAAVMLLALVSLAWAQQPTQTRDGTQISIVGVERTKQWQHKMWPDASSKPMPMGESYKAKSGAEFVVYRVRIRSKAHKISYKRLEAKDVNGKAHKPLLLEIVWDGPAGKGLDVINEIPFAVPQDTRLKTLNIEDFSFDVENLAKPAKG